MCTLSYLPETAHGTRRIFFNRDELRQRSRAHPPALFSAAGEDYLMPLDPQSGGSWMGLHSAGFFICLLNHYPDGRITRDRGFRSRGLLIRDMLDAGTFPDTPGMETAQYAPFFLAAFSRHRTLLLEWDGQELTALPVEKGAGMLSSSSFHHEKITGTQEAALSGTAGVQQGEPAALPPNPAVGDVGREGGSCAHEQGGCLHIFHFGDISGREKRRYSLL